MENLRFGRLDIGLIGRFAGKLVDYSALKGQVGQRMVAFSSVPKRIRADFQSY